MQLAKFPAAIATLELQVLAMSKEIESLTNQIKNIEGEVDSQVGNNPELKNDTQRKGAKTEILQAHKGYKQLQQSLNIQQGERQEKQIELTKIINQFTVARLEMQLQIAQLNKVSVA